MMELSREQSAAALTESKKALVLAGAGSGKTRVLTGRTQHLVENCKVSPYEILSFTFTRKAAGEMQKRLEVAIGSKAYNITMGTMHGVALNMLQRFGELVGLRPGKITVYSSWEEQYLLKDVALELGYHSGKAWKKIKKSGVDRAFYLFYTQGARDPETLHENELMDAFFARCRENNALTYGTILTTFLTLIPKISEFLNFRHILVDEVQDNDNLQWQIVNLLCSSCKASLFAVGDIDQSIYAFRGADPGYLVRYAERFDIYRLQANYRSDGHIVDAANRLIEHNQSRLEKTMVADKVDHFEIMNVPSMDSQGLADFINGTNRPISQSKRAILARNHFMLEKLSRLLDESEIPHEYIGKETGLVRSENFRRFHAFLKLIVNPYDNFSFLLIRDYIGVAPEQFKEIRLRAVQEYKSHFEVWKDMGSRTPWCLWFIQSERGDISTVVDWMKDVEFGFDPDEIFTFVYTWMLENVDKDINDYLNWLATFDIQDEIKEKTNKLQLMTIHASKGLEWPTVIIAGLNEGIFPGTRSIRDNELEDERRLAYVAFTRAEDQLIITSRPFEKDDDGKVKNPVSRFVKESKRKLAIA